MDDTVAVTEAVVTHNTTIDKFESNENENIKIELTELSSNDSSSIHSSENDTVEENVTTVRDDILEDKNNDNDKKLYSSSNEAEERAFFRDRRLESNEGDKPKGLEEFEVSLETLDVKDDNIVKLRQPNEVYMEIWQKHVKSQTSTQSSY